MTGAIIATVVITLFSASILWFFGELWLGAWRNHKKSMLDKAVRQATANVFESYTWDRIKGRLLDLEEAELKRSLRENKRKRTTKR